MRLELVLAPLGGGITLNFSGPTSNATITSVPSTQPEQNITSSTQHTPKRVPKPSLSGTQSRFLQYKSVPIVKILNSARLISLKLMSHMLTTLYCLLTESNPNKFLKET
ncbi:hypothetical protein LguiB_012525 [Lonicera macranthoides]